MKRSIKSVVAIILSALVLCGAVDDSKTRYVAKWGSSAVREMYRSGVPASITLAQGILESNSGMSELSTKGNNHFGIKCHSDWKGKSMRVDDDRKGECFRVYDNAEDSYRDHSDFLRYNDRYKFLFDYPVTDYKSWAYGLKKAGYATDPSYPTKLIKLIEDYNLDRFDTGAEPVRDIVAESEPLNPGVVEDGKEQGAKKNKAGTEGRDGKEKAGHRKASKNKKKEIDIVDIAMLPASPNVIEAVRKLDSRSSEQFNFSLSRNVYSKNGVPFIYSVQGDTYANIASSNNLFYKEILSFNDLTSDRTIAPGTVVYLQKKKNQAQKGLEKYIVQEDGENLRDICQRFAVQMKAIQKLNGFQSGHICREGDTIILRK